MNNFRFKTQEDICKTISGADLDSMVISCGLSNSSI